MCSSDLNTMFKKVLIANRGAIATRIIRTLKKMQIGSVVLASDADRASLHVQEADEVIFLKGNIATETYLNVPIILEKPKNSGSTPFIPAMGFSVKMPALPKTANTSVLPLSAQNRNIFAISASNTPLVISPFKLKCRCYRVQVY